MKITEVEYQQVKSIGTNETCRAAVKVVLEDGESPEKAFEVAKACVRRQLGTQEKQKEEDKEKNRQREAMKTGITDGPIYGYPKMTAKTPGYLTAPEYIEPRPRTERPIQPTPEHELTWEQAIKNDEHRREIVFRRDGVTIRPTMPGPNEVATEVNWPQPPQANVNLNEAIMREIGERLARQTDEMMMGGANGGVTAVGIDTAAGGGGAGDTVGLIQIDELTQGARNIQAGQPF